MLAARGGLPNTGAARRATHAALSAGKLLGVVKRADVRVDVEAVVAEVRRVHRELEAAEAEEDADPG